MFPLFTKNDNKYILGEKKPYVTFIFSVVLFTRQRKDTFLTFLPRILKSWILSERRSGYRELHYQRSQQFFLSVSSPTASWMSLSLPGKAIFDLPQKAIKSNLDLTDIALQPENFKKPVALLNYLMKI